MGRGGRRPNQTGRPKGTTTAPKTKVVRIPACLDEKALVSLRDDLEAVVSSWEAEVNDPEHKTSPRYDAAKRLLAELRGLLTGTKADLP
ncbi:hypothetical protein [Nostoc cycadae]|uniref:DNA topoisomerase III n=1 Tax=Nostoc cycadae WK-1 TaxID=1861711 RepID=A0A2H6LC95_9NOSO|nr:hypothetical protein [Nostoc cycadae]GBE90839.1 DNA topoisomerase III [Nostoc cycadae WK-1]